MEDNELMNTLRLFWKIRYANEQKRLKVDISLLKALLSTESNKGLQIIVKEVGERFRGILASDKASSEVIGEYVDAQADIWQKYARGKPDLEAVLLKVADCMEKELEQKYERKA